MKLKKFEQKDRHGNMFSIEFDTSVPEMNQIPSHPGQPQGTDTVPAWLTPGEFVVNAEATRMFEPQIEAINNAGRAIQAQQGGAIPTYAAEGKSIAVPTPRPEYSEIIKQIPGRESARDVDPQVIYSMLIDRGFTPNAAKGILGNMQVESNFDSGVIQRTNSGAGKGRGLLQWEAGGRFDTDRTNLVNFAESRGKDWSDPETQIDFIVEEMNNSEAFGAVRDAINAAKTPQEAAEIFLNDYEKAGTSHAERRYEYANSFVPQLNEDPIADTRVAQVEVPAPQMEVPKESEGNFLINMLSGWLGNDEPSTEINMDNVRKQELTDRDKAAWASSAGYLAEGGEVNYVPGSGQDLVNKLLNKGYSKEDVLKIIKGDTADVAPIVDEPNVRSFTRMGQETQYQEKDGDWYRRKEDGTLASSPVGGLVAANLNNQSSGLTKDIDLDVEREFKLFNPEAPSFIDDPANQGKRKVPPISDQSEAPVPGIVDKPDQTFLHAGTNTMYTIDAQSGMLKDVYGRPAPVNIQNEFTKSRATGVTAEENTDVAVTKIETKTPEQLQAEADALKAKAQKEVNETGVVSDDTATAIAKNRGIATQTDTKARLDEETRRQQAQVNRTKVMDDYEKAKAQAEAAGITDFPSFDEWKKKQGVKLDTDVDKDAAAANTSAQSDVLTAITNDIASIDDGSASGTTGAQAEAAVTEAGDEGDKKVEQSESFLAGIFGDLFDADELKRMAILYTGSRLMGHSHGGSLNWAANQYLTRVDAKANEHTATVKKLISDAEYTPKSINEYKKTKDASVLVKLGVAAVPSGTKEMWYSPNGKRIQAEKFKVGDGFIWSADGGKTAIPASFHQDESRVQGTDKFNDRIRAEVPLLRDTIKELSTAAGDVTPGNSEKGIKRTQRTDITPTDAALEAATWAAKNNIDTAQMATYVDQAYRMAIAQSGGEDNVRPQSLLPYLNQLKLRQDTGVAELFDVVTENGPAAMDAVKIEQLSRQFLQRAGGEGSISEGRNRDAVNLFWTKAAEIWSQKTRDNPDIITEYQRKAGPGETAFYAYAKEQLNLPMK